MSPRAFLHKETLMSQAATSPGSPWLTRRTLVIALLLAAAALAGYLGTTRSGTAATRPRRRRAAEGQADGKKEGDKKETDADPPRSRRPRNSTAASPG